MPYDVLCIVSPRPGKESRVLEILKAIPDKIKAAEADTLLYFTYGTVGMWEEGMTDYIVRFRVKDESYLSKRRELQHHQDIARYIKEEDLLRQPLKYGKLEPLGGFDRSIAIGS